MTAREWIERHGGVWDERLILTIIVEIGLESHQRLMRDLYRQMPPKKFWDHK